MRRVFGKTFGLTVYFLFQLARAQMNQKMIKTLAAFIAVLAIAACAAPAVTMRHPATGKTVVCGPYAERGPNGPIASAMHETQCINDFKEQGFVRVAN